MSASLTTSGVRETQSLLRRRAARARNQKRTFRVEGRRAQRLIKGIPRDTGRLDASVHGGEGSVLEVGRWGFAVLTSVPYAEYVFRGTSVTGARPPQVPEATIARSTCEAVNRDLNRLR